MTTTKKILLAAAVSAALGAAAPAQAIIFDYNGAASGGQINVTSFDWTVGNALALNAVPLATGQEFQLLSHAALANFLFGTTPVSGTGLNTDFEITFVTSFEETTTLAGATVSSGFATFETTGAASSTIANFFEIWIGSPNSNMLAGTGFNNGLKIASGAVQAGGVGSFATAFNVQDLDQYDSDGAGPIGQDNYPGIDTIGLGAGGTSFDVTVAFSDYDTDYFVNGIGPMTISFGTLQNIPFRETDPSALFTQSPNGVAPTQPGATTASVCGNNTISGCVNGLEGPNFIFQADANSAINVRQVPEPASLALIGLGLIGMGFAGRRRRT